MTLNSSVSGGPETACAPIDRLGSLVPNQKSSTSSHAPFRIPLNGVDKEPGVGSSFTAYCLVWCCWKGRVLGVNYCVDIWGTRPWVLSGLLNIKEEGTSGYLHRWSLGLLKLPPLKTWLGRYTWAKQEHTYVNTDSLGNGPHLTSVTF